jgi:hypothetical protein
MQLVPGCDFWQDNVMRRYVAAKNLTNDPGGACFRYACKWLLCTLYGRPFKSYDASLTGRQPSEDVSAVKGYDKQQQYLQACAPYEKPGTPFSNYLAGIRKESTDFIKIWGNKQGKTGGVKYAVAVQDREFVSLAAARAIFQNDVNLIVGVFGTLRKYTTQKGKAVSPFENWAHAFAYYQNGAAKEKRFFDPNGGEFDIGSEDPATAIEQYAQKFQSGYDKNYGWKETTLTLPWGKVKQFERDLSKPPVSTVYDNGFKNLTNYVLFEVTRK